MPYIKTALGYVDSGFVEKAVNGPRSKTRKTLAAAGVTLDHIGADRISEALELFGPQAPPASDSVRLLMLMSMMQAGELR